MVEFRFLIVNADDLGLTPAVNAGIFAAHEEGIVTSASLMVGRPAAPAAAEEMIWHPDLAVGLHLEPEDCRAQLECFRELGRVAADQAISPEHLIELIRLLPPGWTEIGCHFAAGPVPSSSYDAERQIELRTLIDPRVKNLLNVIDVRLCSFAQVGAR